MVFRDKADTVVSLISKFKDIGSIAAGADPVHVGLPWAGICLLLQVFVAEKEQMDALMNGNFCCTVDAVHGGSLS